MKIQKTEINISAASDILENLRGDDNAICPSNPIVTYDGERLRLTSSIHPLGDDEEILLEGLDGFGDGWNDTGATPEDVIDFLNEQ